MFEHLVQFFIDLGSDFFSLLASFLQTVLRYFYNTFTGWIWAFFTWAGQQGVVFFDKVKDLLQTMNLYPSEQVINQGCYYLGIANDLLPVREAAVGFGIYLAFVVVFCGVKLTLKLIPTIG